jgi:putative nucleotidyltransferase with HDIG domain
MSVNALLEAERARSSEAQRKQPMSRRLRHGEQLVGSGFLAAAIAIALLAPIHSFSAPKAVLFVVAIALAGNVRFDVGAGFTVPTQAIFVPMLFAVPLPIVPLLVSMALALGMLPRLVRGESSLDWLLTATSNSWFSIGPTLVLLLCHDHSPDGRYGVLVLALAAQFAIDFAACFVRGRLVTRAPLRELASEVRPIYTIDLGLSTLGLIVAASSGGGERVWMVVLLAPLFAMLRFFSQERRQRLEQLVELNDAYQGTALLLGDVIEADDSYTGEHCKSVVRLALEVSDELGLDADRKRNVEFGALLHDIGKIAVPNEIINKPGKLNEQEWAVIKTHTIEGQRMLEKIGGFMRKIGHIVRASHESFDGSGYPDGLAGQAIPLEARIVSACDAFNAMTTTRSYRRAMSDAAAVAEMQRCAGTQFDPEVVDALVSVASSAAELASPQPEDSPAASSLEPLPYLPAEAGGPATA